MQATFNGREDVLLAYKGTVNEDLITNLLAYLDAKFHLLKISARIKRKITSVLVESLQNIFWHGHQVAGEQDSEVTVFEKEGSYLVVTGNRVAPNKARDLRARLELLNGLSREELNQSYRSILQQKLKTSPQGSGVGIIDMLRRSGNQIDFSMDKLEDGYYFVSMQIKVAD